MTTAERTANVLNSIDKAIEWVRRDADDQEWQHTKGAKWAKELVAELEQTKKEILLLLSGN